MLKYVFSFIIITMQLSKHPLVVDHGCRMLFTLALHRYHYLICLMDQVQSTYKN